MTAVRHQRHTLALVGAVVAFATLAIGLSSAHAAKTAPLKPVISAHFGLRVDETTGGNVCTVESKDKCQTGAEGTGPGAFAFPYGVAAAPGGNIYVADTVNNRVQELTATGEFIRSFGVAGGLAGQLSNPRSVAVDQNGYVYVEDPGNRRVDKFDAEGRFVWMSGSHVNKKGGNVCTAAEESECQEGVLGNTDDTEAGGFKFEQTTGDRLAVFEGTLFVGDKRRIQKFETSSGKFVGEVRLTAISDDPKSEAAILAVDNSCSMHKPELTEATTPTCKEFDPEYGGLFFVYDVGNATNVVHKLGPNGVEVRDGHFPLTLTPTSPKGDRIAVFALAVDGADKLAITGVEAVETVHFIRLGLVYDGGTGRFIVEFANPGTNGLSFGEDGSLYGIVTTRQEVVRYASLPVAEVVTLPVACSPDPEVETDVIYKCTLEGDVFPWGVDETSSWFEWGTTGILGNLTPPVGIPVKGPEGEEEDPTAISTTVGGLRPNETYYYRVAAYDKNNPSPEEPLPSDTSTFATPYDAPRVVDVLSTPFVRPLSAVMYGEVNPENAATEYLFEYTPAERPGKTLAEICPNGIRKERAICEEAGVASTLAETSSVYGKLGVTQEARGLRPSVKYRYRLFAESKSADNTGRLSTMSPDEGEFTTSPEPKVQVMEGPYEFLTPTSVVIAGWVNPAGEGAVYTFELGRDEGEATQFGAVFWGQVPAGAEWLLERLALSGLDPGAKYAYRIRAEGSFGSAVSQTEVFTTPELPPSPIVASPMLALPPFSLPSETKSCKHGNTRDVHNGKCVKRASHRRHKKAHKHKR